MNCLKYYILFLHSLYKSRLKKTIGNLSDLRGKLRFLFCLFLSFWENRLLSLRSLRRLIPLSNLYDKYEAKHTAIYLAANLALPKYDKIHSAAPLKLTN